MFFLLVGLCFLSACAKEEVFEKPKPAFVFKGAVVNLDSVPRLYRPFVAEVERLNFVKSPGCVVVPDNQQMYEVVGQMAVVGYDPIFLVDDFAFGEKLAKKFGNTTFFSKFKYGENATVARIDRCQAQYLAGAVACLLTENHNFAYLSCDSVSADAFAGINAFMLGAQFVDPLAKMVWYKLGNSEDLPIAKQLKDLPVDDYGLLVVGDVDFELERAVKRLRVPFIGFGKDDDRNRLASFFYNYDPVWITALQDFALDSLRADYDFGMREQAVGLVGFGTKIDQEKIATLENVLGRVDSAKIFVGPIFDQNRNLRVNYGDTISETERRYMDWLVKRIRKVKF